MARISSQYDYLFKYIIIGDCNVGKTNLLHRFAHGKFKNEYHSTIGVEFAAKNIEIENKIYRIQIWDTAGQEKFSSITRNYYKNSVCTLIVYDITCRNSFNEVKNWIEDCKKVCSKDVYMVLIGNKSDLEEQRVITKEEGEELAEELRIEFFETSAKDGTNVEEVFLKSANEIAKRLDEGLYDLNDEACGIRLGNKSNENQSQNQNNKQKLDAKKVKEKKKKKFC